MSYAIMGTSRDQGFRKQKTDNPQKEKLRTHTLAKHELLFPASWRARPRRRSYSASVEEDEGWWLKATRVRIKISRLDVCWGGIKRKRTAATQLGGWV